MTSPAFDSATRLMMIAPHPDDESLAAGLLLQRAVAAGAAVRIIYATDGDDNPWPQRMLEKRWHLNAADRARWGKRRRKEAIAALEVLGLGGANARFLGLPDQGLTRVLLHSCQKVSSRIGQMISDWSPTHLLLPSKMDSHPDHSALAILLHFAADALGRIQNRCELLCYLVHGDHARFPGHIVGAPQDDHEAAVKRQAIAKHWTQVKFSRRRFMTYARRPERFLLPNQIIAAVPMKAVRSAVRAPGELRLLIRFRLKSLGMERKDVCLVGHNRSGAPLAVCMQLPGRNARIHLTDCATSHQIGIATYRGNSFAGEGILPGGLFAADRPVFAKVRHGQWFFDEGWIEIPSLPVEKRAKARPTHHKLSSAV